MLAQILVVDDDPNMLALMRVILLPTGWKVLTARSGNEALDMAHRHQPDLVMLDIKMPGMSGYELCASLRANKRFCQMPIVALTGAADPYEHSLALQSGVDAIITKPISPQALTDRLKAFLAPICMGSIQ
jgi:DNA-binding response OmpR family regulator